MFNSNYTIDIKNTEKMTHCIEDGIARDRFPKSVKEKWENGESDEVIINFKNAIKSAVQIAKRNYKYVIPQYRNNEIQFLMPLYMKNDVDELPDIVLVLSFQEDFYNPETVIPLEWAYNNARVICTPEKAWLNPEKIKCDEDIDEEEI